MDRAVPSPGGRRRGWGLLAATVPLLLNGCASLSNAEKGALAGGALGAGGGALIGSASGNPGLGAAAGGILGGVGGALIGKGIDESEKKTDAKLAAVRAQQAQQVGLTDVASMAQQHISDDIIINQIRTTGSVFTLTPGDIGWLKANGVSDRVIAEMQATAGRLPQRVYSPQPVYAAPVVQPVYVIEQPPPPPSLSLGFGYSRFRCR